MQDPNNTKNARLTIYQFWDSNPLIRPWMKPFLPANPMLADQLVCFVGLIAVGILIFFVIEYVSESNFVVVPLLAVTGAYFPGGWWGRWAKASMRFNTAKQHEGKQNGKQQ